LLFYGEFHKLRREVRRSLFGLGVPPQA
jgi:hypothetical protein